MWMLTGASAALALPYGLGISGLYDPFHGPTDVNNADAAEFVGQDGAVPGFDVGFGGDFSVGCWSESTRGCAPTRKDAALDLVAGLVVPVLVPLADNASLRVDVRGTFSMGKVRAVCEVGPCLYKGPIPDGEPKKDTYELTTDEQGGATLFLPTLTAAIGPDVRLSRGDGVAPHVGALVGGGLGGMFTSSGWYVERQTLAPIFSASALVGVSKPAGDELGWFVDLGYSATTVPSVRLAASLPNSNAIRLQPFLQDGVRLDAGVLFGASR